jgi:ATP-dependent RNA helicase DDX19/DBP5
MAEPAVGKAAEQATTTTTNAPSSPLAIPAMDGAGIPQGGSELADRGYEVHVTLADLQADPNNPLYSVKDFRDLKL